jgi:hypothetical protein
MNEWILGVVGAVTGSGVCGIVLAILQRRWAQADKLADIGAQLAGHIKADDERYARQCRARVLRFNDELIRGLYHTKEHFDDVLGDMTEYNKYCEEHRDFKNEKAVEAMANIKRVYRICESTNGFLQRKEQSNEHPE